MQEALRQQEIELANQKLKQEQQAQQQEQLKK